MFATYFNCLAVIVGSAIGLLLKKRISASYRQVVFASSGLVTLAIGFSMALQTESYLTMLFSMVLGGFCGYALHIERSILSLGSKVERRWGSKEAVEASSSNFARGFLDASILFCSGAMSVVGSIQAGTVGDYRLILVKSVMDGSMAIILAAAYGPGVMASALFVLVYQGFFTLAGGALSPVLGDAGINELSAVGGILLLMIGFGLLDIKKFKTANFLPAMVFAPLLAGLSPYVRQAFSSLGI
jgi:uncharacterized membrane protein YqgA involved in biofilm formation